jgi:hypothetical protein
LGVDKEGKMNICRITGLQYTDTHEDRARHQEELRAAASGTLPHKVREAMKLLGWAALSGRSATTDAETAKLLVAFGRWARAKGRGAPVADFEPFMMDQLAFLDEVEKDPTAQEHAFRHIEKWEKYAR